MIRILRCSGGSCNNRWPKDSDTSCIVVLWGGDFRQILPVVEKGSREDTVYACLRRSYLWQHVQIFHLTQNMRLGQSPEEQAFAQWLLFVGEGSTISSMVVWSILCHFLIM